MFEFTPVEPSEIARAVDRAFTFALDGRSVMLEDGVREQIARGCGGDVRKALGAVELLTSGVPEGGTKSTLADAIAGGAALGHAL